MPSPALAKLTLYPDHPISPLPPLLFGGFVEHLGRCVYGGLYDPPSPLADPNTGLRTDVLSALQDLKLSTLRYPGGNFVSSHDWRDSVGPRHLRPRRPDLAWKSIEPHHFGLNEFLSLCKRLNTQPMLGLNFGTAPLADTAALVEYCNGPTGTPYADLRASHGHPAPHNVTLWCLGNEMDGPWQIGQTDAPTYAARARETSKIIKTLTPSAQTILCGSSSPDLPTYPDWDRTVLETCWDHADYLSMHHYAGNWTQDTPSYLAYSAALESHLQTIESTLRYVKAKLRSKKDIYISWDEWNVWYKNRTADGQWQTAPPLCEEIYNLEDALVVAQWLNLFLRHTDTIKITCLAQVVNALSPLLTTPDQLLKQSTYHPLALVTHYARGLSLSPHITSPTYETTLFGPQPLLDTSATLDPETHRLSIFLVNRSTIDNLPLEIRLPDFTDLTHFQHHHQLSARDPKSHNTFENPSVITPQTLRPLPITHSTARLLLPPLSFTTLSATPA